MKISCSYLYYIKLIKARVTGDHSWGVGGHTGTNKKKVHCLVNIKILFKIIPKKVYKFILDSTVEPPLSGPLLSGHLNCPDSPIGHVACSLLTINWHNGVWFWMKAQGGSLKVAVYLFGDLFILLIITTTWLLEVIMNFYSPGE